jgi:hypothetical protein
MNFICTEQSTAGLNELSWASISVQVTTLVHYAGFNELSWTSKGASTHRLYVYSKRKIKEGKCKKQHESNLSCGHV